MINRVLIRLKVVQIVYAYYKNSGKSLKAAEDEVFFSLSKAYDLYNYMLQLMVGVTHYAADRISFLSMKIRPTDSDRNPNLKFVNNRFIAQLEANEQLSKFAEKSKLNWVDNSDFLRRLLDKIEESDIYQEYMASETSSYEEDKEVWRKLYKTFVFENEELDSLLEEQSLYWNDDKSIVDTFVLKRTMARLSSCCLNTRMLLTWILHANSSVTQLPMLNSIVNLWLQAQRTGICRVWRSWML